MPRIVQVGFGNFGPTHLAAWQQLGCDDVVVVDPDPAAQARCRRMGLAARQVTADLAPALAAADLVDVVAPTDRHFDVCRHALAAGRDVFVEKPMTATAAEAEALAALVEAGGRLLQVGFYFRFHPLALRLKAELAAGSLGTIRHVQARFQGFKRARADSGVVLNDAVHFIDQANWMTGELPEAVDAVTRDHFGRGSEDLALIRLFYPSGTVASVEAGWVLPGRWNDDIVPGATATKEFAVAGSEGAGEIDYQTGELRLHRVRHAPVDGLWRPVHRGVELPHVPATRPVDVVAAELAAFLEAARNRSRSAAPVRECGVAVARIVEAVAVSAREGRRVAL